MIKEYIRETITDWGRYMDTVTPKGVNTEMFLHLKYGNKEKLREFHTEHNLLEPDLVEKVAVYEFMKLPEDEIVRRCIRFLGDE